MLPQAAVGYWDAVANGKPVEEAYPKSTQKALWACPDCQYTWEQRIAILVNRIKFLESQKITSLCPACNGDIIVIGKNDLGTLFPTLNNLYSSSNDELLSAYTRGSSKVVHWECSKCKSSWNRKIKDQIVTNGCPTCLRKSKTALIVEQKIMLEDYPLLFTEFDNTYNEKYFGLKKEGLALTGNKTKNFQWNCVAKGHTYLANLSNRIILNRGCPYCAGRYATPGENDLLTLFPEIVAEYWDYEENTINPSKISAKSNKDYAWKHSCGYKWSCAPVTLTHDKQFCPACSGKRLVVGKNDLASQCPLSLKYWDYTLNILKPEEVSLGLRDRAYFKCPDCQYSYQESIYAVSKALNTRGKYCSACAGNTIVAGNNDLESQRPDVLGEWDYKENVLLPSQVGAYSSYLAHWICSAKKHQWITSVYHRTSPHPTGCPECAVGRSVSRAEKEITDFLSSHNFTVETSIRNILPSKKEIDIYLPEQKFGIEFNGIYWHNEKNKGRTAHYEKYLEAKEEGVLLLQIWEDDWREKKEIVKNAILHKLKTSKKDRIYARKTSVCTINAEQARVFLDLNHIQGFVSGSYYLALKSREDIVSVMVLRKAPNNGLDISRYATNSHVVGGFSKLLKYVEGSIKPSYIITFSDNGISDGNLYSTLGFFEDKIIPPDYMYVVNNTRVHKFNYRKQRFKNDPSLIFDETMTEKELAELNNLPKIWDAGKIRWKKELSIEKET